MRSIAAYTLLAFFLVTAPALSANAPDYGKRAAPIDPSIRSALVGHWTNPLDHLVIKIEDVDLTSGKITGSLSPSTGLAAANAHELVGWVSDAPKRKDADHVVPVSFTTTLYEYGTLPSWTGYLKDGQLVTMSLLAWPDKPYAWDHMTVFQVTWTKL